MRRRLARGVAVGIASGALVMAPMAATASAGEIPDIIIETDWLDKADIIIETDWEDGVDGDIAPLG